MKKRQVKRNSDNTVFKYFFLGMILLIIVQVVFMLGGLLIERQLGVPMTGIPTALGLTLVLIIGMIFARKSEYFLLGSFSLAFISPLILGLIVLFGFMDYSKILFYSIAYLALMILIVWIYYINKILKDRL